LIAMGLAVLAIGMLLNFYEVSTYGEKEIRVQNELNIIALNAGSILLEESACTMQPSFSEQGYILNGCADPNNFESLSKSELMIPNGFECNISWGEKSSPMTALSYCNSLPDGSDTDIASIEREFFRFPANISKASFEKCIELGCANTEYKLRVNVWKGA